MSGAKEASCGGWRNGGSRVRAPCIPFVPGIAETQNLRKCGRVAILILNAKNIFARFSYEFQSEKDRLNFRRQNPEGGKFCSTHLVHLKIPPRLPSFDLSCQFFKESSKSIPTTNYAWISWGP